MEKYTCCICGKVFTGYGNNPEPVKPYADNDRNPNRCCDECNVNVVIPARIEELVSQDKAKAI